MLVILQSLVFLPYFPVHGSKSEPVLLAVEDAVKFLSTDCSLFSESEYNSFGNKSIYSCKKLEIEINYTISGSRADFKLDEYKCYKSKYIKPTVDFYFSTNEVSAMLSIIETFCPNDISRIPKIIAESGKKQIHHSLVDDGVIVMTNKDLEALRAILPTNRNWIELLEIKSVENGLFMLTFSSEMKQLVTNAMDDHIRTKAHEDSESIARLILLGFTVDNCFSNAKISALKESESTPLTIDVDSFKCTEAILEGIEKIEKACVSLGTKVVDIVNSVDLRRKKSSEETYNSAVTSGGKPVTAEESVKSASTSESGTPPTWSTSSEVNSLTEESFVDRYLKHFKYDRRNTHNKAHEIWHVYENLTVRIDFGHSKSTKMDYPFAIYCGSITEYDGKSVPIENEDRPPIRYIIETKEEKISVLKLIYKYCRSEYLYRKLQEIESSK